MLVFYVLAAVMLAGAVGVVTLRQPVHAALALVGTLLTLGIAYVQLHAHFLAAIQVIVYAGAIMVLFLFVIMLLAVGRERTPRLRWLRPASWIVGGLAALGLAASVLASPRPLPSADAISAVFVGSGIDGLADQLFGPFLLVFQLVGVLLLTGIVGAVGLVQRTARPVQLRPAVPPTPKGASGPPAEARTPVGAARER